MRAGSYGHRSLFCDAFIASHRDIDVDAVVWPALGNRALALLRGVSFFGTALSTKRNSAAMLAAYAAGVDDPVVRGAIELLGSEEARDARLLESFLREYSIPHRLQRTPAPPPLRSEFDAFGYRESLETFLGWGLFSAIAAIEVFPMPFVRLVDSLFADESRHLVFFANYVAYERAREGREGMWNELRDTLTGYWKAAVRTAGMVAWIAAIGPWSTKNGAGVALESVDFRGVLERGLSENERHMNAFDPRLKRPRFVPMCAQVALVALRLRRRRTPVSAA